MTSGRFAITAAAGTGPPPPPPHAKSPQKRPKTPRVIVAPQPVVNGLVRDAQPPVGDLTPQAAGNLIGRPILPQPPLDVLADHRPLQLASPPLVPPLMAQLLGRNRTIGRPITIGGTNAVPLQLAEDRAAMTP
jgi:hypothetical protein